MLDRDFGGLRGEGQKALHVGVSPTTHHEKAREDEQQRLQESTAPFVFFLVLVVIPAGLRVVILR